ncbi:uncharacterized protein LOC131319234 isoform X2 [Rhododendron vialii]|uniref:uncharacterized protein LOC131319234 isoform X2 n=1 Tax=Rhododendron vialii TaxID=182163 RepID=UPI00265DD7F2|nr:uncharacterized protein LOC131319234 isoform X2 [Rhododendron vialii]
MMSLITSSVFIFYLCICSSHACNARRLGLTDNGGGFGKRLLFPSKAFPNMVVNMDSTKKGAEFGDSIGYKSTHGGEMITEKPKGMKFSAEEEAAAISGNKIEESSSHMGLQKAIEIEDPRWQNSGRVILEHDPHGIQQQEEETHSTYHNSVNEVVQEVDYEPAHMNIPTHN